MTAVDVNCFAYKGYGCAILKDVEVAEYCRKCRFKKPERDVTNGVRYPKYNFSNVGGKPGRPSAGEALC